MKVTDYSNTHQAYKVGILSTLDAIFNESIAPFLSKIILSEVMNEALLHHVGKLGTILKVTLDYETTNFKQLKNCCIDLIHLAHPFVEALAYANSILTIIQP